MVELEPAVVEASKFFVKENRGVLRDPRVRLVVEDGRNFILTSEKRYDVISSEPLNPWMAGVASLFSRDFYQTGHLAPSAEAVRPPSDALPAEHSR